MATKFDPVIDDQCLSLVQIERLVGEALEGSEWTPALEHLEHCERCRIRQIEAAERMDWLSILREHYEEIPPALEAEQWPAIRGYQIIRELGRGGSSTVYEAEQLFPTRRVAIKILDSRRPLEHFERETQALARLQHQSICTVLDAGLTVDGHCYLVTELVRGLPLDTWVLSRTPSIEDRLDLFESICAAIEYAHHQGVIHGDLKPGNIMVTPTGHPIVLDFGLARLMTTADDPARMAGTLAYISPEQLDGAVRDPVTEVYSLGSVLFFLLCGQPPVQVRRRQLKSVIEDIRQGRVSEPVLEKMLPPDVLAISNTCRSAKRLERYQDIQSLREDVQRYRAGKPLLRQRKQWWIVARKFVGRHRGAMIVGIAMLIMMTALSTHRTNERSEVVSDRIGDMPEVLNDEVGALYERVRSVLGDASRRDDVISEEMLWRSLQNEWAAWLAGSELSPEAIGRVRARVEDAVSTSNADLSVKTAANRSASACVRSSGLLAQRAIVRLDGQLENSRTVRIYVPHD